MKRRRRLPLKVSNGPGRAKNEGRHALVNGHRQPERSGPKSANKQTSSLLDHFVGARGHRRRCIGAQRLDGRYLICAGTAKEAYRASVEPISYG
jgi:hypothetical protein